MNRKSFLGSVLGLGFLSAMEAFAKEKVQRLIKDYAGDTVQVRRLEIVNENGEAVGFVEERDGKMVMGSIKKPESPKETPVGKNLIYQEPSPYITGF